MTGIPGLSIRSAPRSSSPFSLGMTTSVMTALGSTAEIFCSATHPSEAVSTSYPQMASSTRSPSREEGSSSATKIRSAMCLGHDGAGARPLSGGPPEPSRCDGNPVMERTALAGAADFPKDEGDGSLPKRRLRDRAAELDHHGAASPQGQPDGGRQTGQRRLDH